MEEQRIYVVVAGAVKCLSRQVVQPSGRQIAQASHAVSKLRIQQRLWEKSMSDGGALFYPITTIILQARDSHELMHNFFLLQKKKALVPVRFYDTNDSVYGLNIQVLTAIAVLATKKQTIGILDYLPMWGAQ